MAPMRLRSSTPTSNTTARSVRPPAASIPIPATESMREVAADPVADVGHDVLLAHVIEKVVVVVPVELERLVGRADFALKALASARAGHVVGGSVNDEDRQGDRGGAPGQPLVGARELRHRLR